MHPYCRNIYNLLIGLVIVIATSSAMHAKGINFEVRGISLDLRTQVMTVPALKSVIKDAAKGGINTVIIEYEATFPFDKHATISNQYRYSKNDIKSLVNLCSQLDVDLIPLQHCFGHSEYILQHDRYASLREDNRDMSQVCPLQIDEAKELFGDLFREIAALHPSKYFHIGADETRLLGTCKRCKRKANEQGVSQLFVDYVKEMCNIVISLDKTPVIWGDMILQHPEALEELPKELVIIDWNYGWEPDHFGNVDDLIKKGYIVWGASAMRCAPDNIYLTQWKKHFENISTYLPFSYEHGYKGMINTSWSTSGRYGYIYDNGWNVTELQPIRQVYPMSGFTILQEAYSEALTSENWDYKTFIEKYGKEHFGLDADGQQVLVDYIEMPQDVVSIAKTDGEDINEMLKTCVELNSRLQNVKPKRNKKDFEQLKLMLDIRINYLQFKHLEMHIESDKFNSSDYRGFAGKLKHLLDSSQSLVNRFAQLNKHYLKKPKESFGKWDYVTKMQDIYDTLSASD